MHWMRLYRIFKRYVYLKFKYLFMDVLLYRNIDLAVSYENIEYIGFIDQDGLIHCAREHHDLFHSINLYLHGDFIRRHRYSLHIVRINNRLLIEKNYKGNTLSFYNEIFILSKLRDLEFIPKVSFISYKRKTVYLDYIHGAVLREQLASLGANIRDVDLIRETRNFEQKAESARIYLRQAISEKSIKRIKESYEAIHTRKIIVNDIKYGNIIMCGDRPYLIDFETSIYFPELPGFLFRRLAEIDKYKIETLFHV